MRSKYYCRLSDEERRMRKAAYERTRREYFRERYRNMTPEQKDAVNRARMARRSPEADRRAWHARYDLGHRKAMREARKEARATGQRLSDIMHRMGVDPAKVEQYRSWGR